MLRYSAASHYLCSILNLTPQFIYQRVPYANRNHMGQIIRDIIKGYAPAPRPMEGKASEDGTGTGRLWDTFEACWNVAPESRPTAIEISEYLIEYAPTLAQELDSQYELDF